MRKVVALIFIVLGLMSAGIAQQDLPLINSGDIIRQGMVLNDSGLYKKAFALYDKVSRNDTNYVWALYQKAVTLEADSQFVESIRYCQKALSLADQRELEPKIFNQYGNDLVDLHDYKKAISIYDSALLKYPAYSVLKFNRSIAYMNLDSLGIAEQSFKEAILLNPYQYSAHYFLGLVALRQGKVVPAFLSLIGYLLMTPEGSHCATAINLLSEIAKSTDEIVQIKNKRVQEPGSSYQMMEEILLSKIALDKQYKPVIKLDDPISRQIQVVFEKLEYDESDSDFYMQYYLPYFKRVYESGQFETFINHIFLSAKLPVILEYAKKNKKEDAALIDSAAAYFNRVRSTREISPGKRRNASEFYLWESGEFAGRGKLINNMSLAVGDWEFTYAEGNKKAVGKLNDAGKKVGQWKFYYYNGKLKDLENYVDGNLEGKQMEYFDNGLISYEKEYHNDQLHGSSVSYYRVGTLLVVSKYIAGELDGEKKVYYPTGAIHSIARYSKGKEEGEYTTYHENGHVQESGAYKDGMLEGISKSYYDNDTLSTVEFFIKGKREGERKTYHENGRLKEKEFYKNDLLEGVYEQYFDNGQLYTRFNYTKGKANEEISYFGDDGKLFSKLLFEKDILKAAGYFDKSGREIHRSDRKDNKLDLETYTSRGYKVKQALYDQKGNSYGTQTTFYSSGSISSKVAYLDGVMNGLSVTFYPNGNIHTEINMAQGGKNGLSKEYYQHGQLQSTGWYIDDVLQGDWFFYDEQGRLISKAYYRNGDLWGYREEFWPNGKKSEEQLYTGGWLESIVQYDSAGNELNHAFFPGGSGKYQLSFPNGKKMESGEYVRGYLDGKFETYYFDGSLKSVEYFKRGAMDSLHKVFYYGGQVYAEGNEKDGARDGVWKTYDEEGHLVTSGNYVKGNLTGIFNYYYKDGKTELDTVYKNGQRNGLNKKYDLDGTLMYQVRYEEDEPIAYSYQNKNGELIPEKPVNSAGDLIKTYYASGRISREFSVADALVNGEDILYFKNGHQRSSNRMLFGVNEGMYKEYYQNAQLKSETTYLHGNSMGVYREFNEKGEITEEGNYDNGNYHDRIVKYNNPGHVKQVWVYYYGTLLTILK